MILFFQYFETKYSVIYGTEQTLLLPGITNYWLKFKIIMIHPIYTSWHISELFASFC